MPFIFLGASLFILVLIARESGLKDSESSEKLDLLNRAYRHVFCKPYFMVALDVQLCRAHSLLFISYPNHNGNVLNG